MTHEILAELAALLDVADVDRTNAANWLDLLTLLSRRGYSDQVTPEQIAAFLPDLCAIRDAWTAADLLRAAADYAVARHPLPPFVAPPVAPTNGSSSSPAAAASTPVHIASVPVRASSISSSVPPSISPVSSSAPPIPQSRPVVAAHPVPPGFAYKIARAAARRAAIADLYRAGHTPAAIVEQLGLGQSTVYKYIKELQAAGELEHNPDASKDGPGRRRCTPAHIERMLTMLHLKNRAIAEAVGLPVSTVAYHVAVLRSQAAKRASQTRLAAALATDDPAPASPSVPSSVPSSVPVPVASVSPSVSSSIPSISSTPPASQEPATAAPFRRTATPALEAAR